MSNHVNFIVFVATCSETKQHVSRTKQDLNPELQQTASMLHKTQHRTNKTTKDYIKCTFANAQTFRAVQNITSAKSLDR